MWVWSSYISAPRLISNNNNISATPQKFYVHSVFDYWGSRNLSKISRKSSEWNRSQIFLKLAAMPSVIVCDSAGSSVYWCTTHMAPQYDVITRYVYEGGPKHSNKFENARNRRLSQTVIDIKCCKTPVNVHICEKFSEHALENSLWKARVLIG